MTRMRSSVARFRNKAEETALIESAGRTARATVDALRELARGFCDALEAKLFSMSTEDLSGWDSPDWTPQQISAAIREHVEKGDPIGVAAFCALLWNRYGSIMPREAAEEK